MERPHCEDAQPHGLADTTGPNEPYGSYARHAEGSGTFVFSSCFWTHLEHFQKEAREHFGCDTLDGAELENQGSDGTVFTHWEKRVFEVMFAVGHYFLCVV